MTKEIYITRKGEQHICLVDDEYYPLLMQHNWHALPTPSGSLYAYAPIHVGQGLRKMIAMTHMIMGSVYHVDHVDRNTLNNQKENLRGATWQQNGWNKGPNKTCRGKPRESKYKGVIYCPLRGRDRWFAQIRHVEEGAHKSTGKTLRLGYFWSEDDAARAYNRKVVELRGKWAWQNPVPEPHN